jgi:hypothetical protein
LQQNVRERVNLTVIEVRAWFEAHGLPDVIVNDAWMETDNLDFLARQFIGQKLVVKSCSSLCQAVRWALLDSRMSIRVYDGARDVDDELA